MKRIVQEPGIKKWAGDDFVALQAEPMKVLDLMFKPYGACIIEGCQVVGNEIKPGIVALQGVGSDGLETFKVVPFAGQKNIASFPVYLVLAVEPQVRDYVDGMVKPVAYDYYAKLSTVVPSVSNYLVVNTAGNRYLVDAIQDSKHRFVSDTEKATWNAKASTAVATQSSNGLMASGDKTKLDGVQSGANNYAHPANHPASIITQDAANRFVTDAEKATWNAKAGTAVATTSANGLMASADKTKLDGIATGANNYAHPANHPASIISQDSNNRFVSDAEKAAWNKINNIKIGGRNLADGTNRGTFNYILGGYYGNLTIYSPNNFAYNNFGVAVQNMDSPTGNLLFLLDKTRFIVGQTYTISFDFYSQNAASAIKAMLVESQVKTVLSDGARQCIVGSNYLTYTGVYTSVPSGQLHFELSGFDYPYTYVLANLKIEKGNIATDYSLSENDVIYSPIATTSTNGLMSSEDKTKLDGIQANVMAEQAKFVGFKMQESKFVILYQQGVDDLSPYVKDGLTFKWNSDSDHIFLPTKAAMVSYFGNDGFLGRILTLFVENGAQNSYYTDIFLNPDMSKAIQGDNGKCYRFMFVGDYWVLIE